MIRSVTIVLSLIYVCALFSQEPPTLTHMQQKCRSFEYDSVIAIAEDALTQPERFTSNELISIYEMKAISHFAQSEFAAAKTDFGKILQLDSLYTPDPVKTSPKIIDFFTDVKAEFQRQSEQPAEQPPTTVVQRDTITVTQETLGRYRTSIPASLLLPGSGHLLMGETKRGAIMTALSLVTLTSAAYFTNQTREKHSDYMNAIDEQNIAAAYDSYNSAFKTRNILWATYAVVWLYAQTDLLYFHQDRQRLNLGFTLSPDSFSPTLALRFRF